MNLSELALRPEYTKGDDDIAADFYLPCMSAATSYDRVTGYFSSSVYVLAWPAMRGFVSRGGQIRIICSPVMSPGDIDGLERANDAQTDEALASALTAELQAMLSEPGLRRASQGLACLIVAGIVEIRLAMLTAGAPATARRMFHDKVGVFHDDAGASVGFRGSMNETFLGLSPDGNLESIDVFPSWMGGRDGERTDKAMSRFEDLWADRVLGVKVSPLPKRIRDVLVEASSDSDWELIADELAGDDHGEDGSRGRRNRVVGGRTLFPHQDSLLTNWINNDRRGIAEAATGAGKTTIGIAAARDGIDHDLGVLVLVPSALLLDQWDTEMRQLLPDVRILRFGDGDRSWARPGVLRRLSAPAPGERRAAVATIQTASQPEFLRLVGAAERLMLIADEAHRLGSPAFSRVMNLDPPARLGLSATPRRFGDPEGTDRLLSWFGGVLQPQYSLAAALRDNVLTPYSYHPHHVELSEDEHKSWMELSVLIGRRAAAAGTDAPGDETLKRLLIRRARIAKNATAKITLAVRVLREEFRPGQRWLVYCDSQQQVIDIRGALDAAGIPSLEYHSSMTGDRRVTLADFEVNGGVIVAIRCLDEGVDLPAVTHALILASSRNPREFIQRRGRVLRRYRGKSMAHVHDALITPPSGNDTSDKLLIAELGRAVEFARSASNPECLVDLETLCAHSGIDSAAVRDLGDEEDTNDDD